MQIVVVDHADVISMQVNFKAYIFFYLCLVLYFLVQMTVACMQNWAHLEAVFEQLNQLPSKEHGTNVMRIRPWQFCFLEYFQVHALITSTLCIIDSQLSWQIIINYLYSQTVSILIKSLMSKVLGSACTVLSADNTVKLTPYTRYGFGWNVVLTCPLPSSPLLFSSVETEDAQATSFAWELQDLGS